MLNNFYDKLENNFGVKVEKYTNNDIRKIISMLNMIIELRVKDEKSLLDAIKDGDNKTVKEIEKKVENGEMVRII